MRQKVTVLLHKPMHYLACQADSQQWNPTGRCQGVDVQSCKKLVVAGRLDADSSGLQVLTQDGRIAAQLLGGAGESVSKEYLVQVDIPPSDAALTLLQSGLSLDGCELLPAVVRLVHPQVAKRLLNDCPPAAHPAEAAHLDAAVCQQHAPRRSVFFTIELREGRNRQIRRMCELVGLRVLRIHRIRIGNVHLGQLPLGHWRFLQPGETF
ncbi:uncharacterized protein LOC34617676 [Cyclospora cayetanensis]|uniref:Uncharacterized protein LOC34617676 n=1 Tax=Cyclospora cayetanensis TaxID=88456 RepID=A0A6P6S265_9EIME|nr:uncharacterized protein LOC34617676 [Cyclospora cayetanensis]